MSSLLEITNLQAGYGNLQVLWDVSLNINEGEFVVLLGPNGAGKTTTIRANFDKANTNAELTEINVRESIFMPKVTGLKYITVRTTNEI